MLEHREQPVGQHANEQVRPDPPLEPVPHGHDLLRGLERPEHLLDEVLLEVGVHHLLRRQLGVGAQQQVLAVQALQPPDLLAVDGPSQPRTIALAAHGRSHDVPVLADDLPGPSADAALAPSLGLGRERLEVVLDGHQGLVASIGLVHGPLPVDVHHQVALGAIERFPDLLRVHVPGLAGTDEGIVGALEVRGLEDVHGRVDGLRHATDEMPSRVHGRPHVLPGDVPAVPDDGPGLDRGALERGEEVLDGGGAVASAVVDEMDEGEPVRAGDHERQVDLLAPYLVGVVAELSHRATHAEEEHARHVVCERLLRARGERLELAPAAVERVVDIAGVVQDQSRRWVLAADEVEGGQEGFLGEVGGGEAHDAGQVRGGYPVLELRAALGVDGAVDGPGGEELARRGPLDVPHPAADAVDGLGHLNLLGQCPEEGDVARPLGGAQVEAVQDRGLRPPCDGGFWPAAANIEAFYLAIHAHRAVFLEIHASVFLPPLESHVGGNAPTG